MGRLLATDMDRTLLPNGLQKAVPQALERFRAWASGRRAQLAYVTGRHHDLARAVLAEYRLPEPDWLVCNVGTEIYPAGCAEPVAEWQRRLARGFDAEAVRERAAGLLPEARLQEAPKQSPLKVSFYTKVPEEPAVEEARLEADLAEAGLAARVIVSHDETAEMGLVDFLAPGSGKASALGYLRERTDLGAEQTLFAGDSGNDADALLSGVCGILVGNATAAVREQIRQWAAETPEARVYFAERPYTAGILEGMVHYGWSE